MYALNVPSWMTQVTTLSEPMRGARNSDLCDGVALARQVYGTVLSRDTGLTAFAYLWRRFGPPWWGCDPHKDLVGYMLHTPDPQVILTLSLSGSRLDLAVGYLIPATLEAELYHRDACKDWEAQFEGWWVQMKLDEEGRAVLYSDPADDDPRLAAISTRFWDARFDTAIITEAETTACGPYPGRVREHSPRICDAITAALEELLRPVFIRDVPVTILGRLDKRAPCYHPAEAAEAKPSRYAGYGIPQEAMDAQCEEEDEEEARC